MRAWTSILRLMDRHPKPDIVGGTYKTMGFMFLCFLE
jgi:hypothetical protein